MTDHPRTPKTSRVEPSARRAANAKPSSDIAAAGFSEFPLERVHRLIEPGPIIMVSTSRDGRPNLMTNGFNMSVVHEPPILALVVGPWDYSYEALRETRECVIAIPSIDLAARMVDVGNVSGRDVDKWERFAFTPLPAITVAPPLVGECFANIECRVADDRLVADYNLWLLEPTRVWFAESKRGLGEFHHRGDGTFSTNGETIDMKQRMTKWQALVED
jgi:flavin reductase (DIM6/NTAB) family NADH-FMN oxidoreductase RutF